MRPPLASIALAAALFFAPPSHLAAQRPLRVSATQALTFGNVFPGVSLTVTPVDLQRAAQFDVTAAKFSQVQLVFSLPATMTAPGASMPLSFGATAAGYSASGSTTGMIIFDPRVPTTITLDNNGRGTVFLGGTARPLGQQRSGQYTGTITLTVSLLSL